MHKFKTTGLRVGAIEHIKETHKRKSEIMHGTVVLAFRSEFE